MRRNFSKITGLLFSTALLFSAKAQGEGESIEENIRPQLDIKAEADLDLNAANVLQMGELLASRDNNSSPVDRAFGKMDKRRAKSQRYKYWYLLPLGIPQFTEGYRGIGSAFAVGQVGALAFYYDRLKKVDSLNAAATDATRNVSPQQAAQNPLVLNFLNANEKAVQDAQKEQQFFLFTLVGLYGLSVYEALYDPLDMRKVDALRKKKRDRDRDRDDDDSRDRDRDRGDNDNDDEAQNEPRSRSRFSFMVLPSDKSYDVAMGWQMTLE